MVYHHSYDRVHFYIFIRFTFLKTIFVEEIYKNNFSGDKSEWGRHGEDHAVADGVAFEFRDSKLSICTYVERGQIPEIYFEVIINFVQTII